MKFKMIEVLAYFSLVVGLALLCGTLSVTARFNGTSELLYVIAVLALLFYGAIPTWKRR